MPFRLLGSAVIQPGGFICSLILSGYWILAARAYEVVSFNFVPLTPALLFHQLLLSFPIFDLFRHFPLLLFISSLFSSSSTPPSHSFVLFCALTFTHRRQ